VDDHVNALLLILERGRVGETYAVGPRAEHANIDVVTRICDLVGADARERVRHVEDRPGHDRRYAIDPKKIETELGWRPQIGFEDGLVQTVRWYQDNDWWWKPLREAGHGRARLGSKGAP
jgi:dTDP-glucose 4,6-dehydratase